MQTSAGCWPGDVQRVHDPDVVELTRQHYEHANRRDFDTMMGFFGPDAVWDTSPVGLGTYEGPTAIRGFIEGWIGAYEEWQSESDEVLDLGSGVVFVVVRQSASFRSLTRRCCTVGRPPNRLCVV
jgi:ketosteroid isomerase-like protein